MNINAGDIKQLLIDGREMDTASEGEVELRLAGYTNEVTSTANGRLKQKKTRRPAAMNGIPVLLSWERKDFEFLQEKADSFTPMRVKLVLTDGTVYNAVNAVINEEFTATTSEAQCDINIVAERIEQF